MKKVLVIDNNIDSLTVIQLILSAEEYQVNSFSDWKKGLAAIKSYQPGLIILQVDLITADGRNLAKHLKFDQLTKMIPVLLISRDQKVEKSLLECGADQFLKEPFSIDQLLERVHSILKT